MPHFMSAVKDSSNASSPNPFASMMTRVFEPILQQTMQQMMGSMMGGFGMPGMGMMPPAGQPAPGQQPAAQGAQSGIHPGGGREISKDEFEEVWK
jgi:hypothetical protein